MNWRPTSSSTSGRQFQVIAFIKKLRSNYLVVILTTTVRGRSNLRTMDMGPIGLTRQE